MRAIVVDKDYGSVTPQELDRVAAAYQAAGIQMELLEYQVEATRQKEPCLRADTRCGILSGLSITLKQPSDEQKRV